GAGGPGDDLPEVSAQGAGEKVCLGGGAGRRAGAVPGWRADPGASGGAGGTDGEVGAAKQGAERRPGGGGADVAAGHGAGVVASRGGQDRGNQRSEPASGCRRREEGCR